MFWDVFEVLCVRLGKSPNAVAAELGLSNATTTAWKKGSMPRIQTLQKVAKYFNVSPEYLISYDKIEKSPAPVDGDEAERQELIQILSALDPAGKETLLTVGRSLKAAYEAQGNGPKSP